MNRRLEIITFENGERVDIYRGEEGALTVEPWIFQPDKFSVSVEVHHLDQLAFSDDGELEEALRECNTTVSEWTFRQSRGSA